MKPTHGDMTLIEQCLQRQDAAAEGNVPMAEMIPDIDPDAIMYAADQRAMRAAGLGNVHQEQVVRQAIWLDGFAAGAEVRRRQGKGEE